MMWRPLKRSAGRSLAALLAVAAFAVGPSCEAPPAPEKAAAPKRLPTLDEVRSNVTPVAPPPNSELGGTQRFLCDVELMILPAEASLEQAWSELSHNVLSQRARTVWAANGFRVGVLANDQLRDFVKALPTPLESQTTRTLATRHPFALRSVALRSPVDVDLTIQPDSPKVEQITGGRGRLVVQMLGDAMGATSFRLLPHHHVARWPYAWGEVERGGNGKATIKPRSPLEKELDGRLFRELATHLKLEPGQALVVALAPPAVRPDRDFEEQNASPDEDEPANDEAIAEADALEQTRDEAQPPDEVGFLQPVEVLTEQSGMPEKQSQTLGDVLLRGSLHGHPVQVMIVLRVQPGAETALR